MKQEDIEKIEELNKRLDKVYEEYSQIEDYGYDNDEDYLDKLHDEAENIKQSIYEEKRKFESNSLKIIAQFKKGVLLKKKLTNRNNKVYYYGRQYSPGLSAVLREFEDAIRDPEYAKELINLGKENLMLLKKIMDDSKILSKIENEYSERKVKNISFDKPITIYSVGDERFYRDEIHCLSIFADEFEAEDSSGSRISLSSNKKYFKAKYKDILQKETKLLIEYLKDELNKIKDINTDLETEGGKLLIVASF